MARNEKQQLVVSGRNDVEDQDTSRHTGELYEADILTKTIPSATYGPFLAIVLLSLVSVFLIVVAVVNVPIRKPGSLGNTDHALYVTGTTVLATWIATFSGGQVRLLWARKLLRCSASSRQAGMTLSGKEVGEIRTLLGLGTWREKLRYWSTTCALLIIGLLTTAMVAGITPSVSQVQIDALSTIYLNPLGPCFYATETRSSAWFSWRLANGSFLNLNDTSTDQDCPINVLPRFLGPTKDLPNDYAYVAGGIPVSPLAVGTPFDLGTGYTGFADAFGVDGPYDSEEFEAFSWEPDFGALDLLQSATMCAPVFTRSPVECRKTGNLSVNQSGITVTARNCTASSPIFSVNPLVESASTLGACTDPDQIGKATIVIGSVHGHAQKLSQVMCDNNTDTTDLNISSYSIACSVDIASAIDFREVKYSRVTPRSYADSYGYLFVLDGTGKACRPSQEEGALNVSTLLTPGALANGAAASYRLLWENVYRDGWWDTLHSIADRRVGAQNDLLQPVYNNTVNALEDTLGVVSAIVLSLYWGTGYGSDSTGTGLDGGTSIFSGVRIGSGRSWAIVYVVPELFTIILLIYLRWKIGK